MAEYNGFLRFSDEAVAAVSWDDQQHSGEAGVTDEKTGTVYPFGGGGDDLIELEYTVANYKAYLTKTPAELWELLQAGKNFKIVVNSDMAQYDIFNVGDVFILTLYNYDTPTNKLIQLIFNLTPFPASGEVWNAMTFDNENGTMSTVVAD